MGLLQQYYNLSKTKLFLGIVLANLFILWLSKTFLMNEMVFYNTYSEQLTYDRALRLFENINKWSWINYVLVPIMLVIKYTLVSIVLYTGVFFCNLHYKISFGSIYKIVIASDVIFLIPGLIKFLWFLFISKDYDLNDLGFFYPLSLINLFKITEVNKIWIYPLQILNLFQFIYVFALSYGLRKVGNISDSESDKIVLSSYLPALALWIVLIMFISIDSGL
jgi:hypothetical protein